MTTYRLPDALGGGEYEGVREGETVGFTGIPGVAFTLWFHITDVTEVPPPPPGEPEPGAYDIGGAVAVRFAGYAGINRWRWDSETDHDGYGAGSWDELWTDIGGPALTIRRLILEPDRLDPVELPWEYTIGPNAETRVAVYGGGVVDTNRAIGAYATTVQLSPGEARAKAHALLTAAAQAELPDWERELLEGTERRREQGGAE